MSDDGWQKTACILCSVNCGIEVKIADRRIERVRGDKAHPGSQGYTCEKALRLDHYQNARDRLTSPLRRRADGTFEEIDWDTAIAGIATGLAKVRDIHGGPSIFYYGGGGQGNHLGGLHSVALRRALGAPYNSNALAQEKTGEFWVDGQLFGRTSCHTAGDFEHAEVALFVGKNPWQSHGFPRARTTLKAMANDPERAIIVIDPRRSETADLADIHLAVRPGTDAFCLAALAATFVQENLVDKRFLAERTANGDELFAELATIPVDDYARRAGLDPSLVRTAARRMARAESVSIFEDLGIQQAPHSTLNSYLEKLLFLLTGNFGRPGTMNIHTRFGSLGGGRGSGEKSPVVGAPIISGLVPCNLIADEILTDHPARYRAMIVESANPLHSLADSARLREAFATLELVVVIDVALTETARAAHYVLPAASQFEKWEATFFTLEFPHNVFHLRRPVLEALPGTLPEPEIHARLLRALGVIDDDKLAPLLAAARESRQAFADAFFAATAADPELGAVAPVVLHETLGQTMPDGAAAAAALWGVAHRTALAYPDSVRRAGFEGEGFALGEALFDAVLSSPSGITFSIDDYDETWRRVLTPDGRINLTVTELLPELRALRDEQPPAPTDDYPFVLSAGERRSGTANTVVRDPAWRKRDAGAPLRMSSADADRLGVGDGDAVRVTTKVASVVVAVAVTDTMQPGHLSLPNGQGLSYPDDGGAPIVHGVAPNELTSADDRDWFAGTPWHKHARARVEAVVRARVEDIDQESVPA